MRILAIEASSERGSVALLEKGVAGLNVVSYADHCEPNQHAERLLDLVKRVFVDAAWKKSSLDRIAVGVGPGSFTGVRVGLALTQGLVLGLGVEGVGVGSLRAVAEGLSRDDLRARVVVRDARRNEYFIAVYSPDGEELVAPQVIAQEGASSKIAEMLAGTAYVVLGTELEGVSCDVGEQTREPDARAVARIGLGLEPIEAPLRPRYLRGPNLVRPSLPASPLSLPRS